MAKKTLDQEVAQLSGFSTDSLIAELYNRSKSSSLCEKIREAIKKQEEEVIYISLPITGEEDTYDERLESAIAEVYDRFGHDVKIITPKDVVRSLNNWFESVGQSIKEDAYELYLAADVAAIIKRATAVLFCSGWSNSKGCNVEYVVASQFGKDIYISNRVGYYDEE